MKALPMVILCSLLMGCAAPVNHRVALKPLVSQIVIKQTNKGEVRRLFGPPHLFQSFPDGLLTHETWSYWYDGSPSKSVNSIPPELTITFSRDGIVQSLAQYTSQIN